MIKPPSIDSESVLGGYVVSNYNAAFIPAMRPVTNADVML